MTPSADDVVAAAVLVHPVRTLNSGGVTSVSAPSGVHLTMTLRPRSIGRVSSQYMSSPSNCSSPKPTLDAEAFSAVMGDLHDP